MEKLLQAWKDLRASALSTSRLPEGTLLIGSDKLYAFDRAFKSWLLEDEES